MLTNADLCELGCHPVLMFKCVGCCSWG